jgi:hypothetical protein
MGHRQRREGLSIRTLLGDRFVVAAEAVVCGSVHESHWDTLLAFAERDGIDEVAQALARHEDFKGRSREWWRCLLLLAAEVSEEQALRLTRELIMIEEAGGGPSFDVDRHALEVSGAVRYLQTHLQRVGEGVASEKEQRAVGALVQAVRVARVRRGA